MSAFEITIPLHPVPKGRPRWWNGRMVTPKETSAYEAAVSKLAKLYANVKRWVFPVSKTAEYRFTARFYRQYLFKGGDIDNLMKSLADGLNGIAYSDDGRITEAHLYIVQDAANPRTEVIVELIERMGK